MLRRHPVLVAQAALTLSELTKRPMILGVGAGERLNTEPYGLDAPKRVARFEEALEVIRLCFESSGTFDFHGEHFDLDGAVMDLAPSNSRTPEIWIAAHGPRMLGITGRYGDGWIPCAPPLNGPADYEAAWKTIQTAAEDAGRPRDSITPSLLAFALVGRTESHVGELLRSKFVRYWALMGTSAEWWDGRGFDHPFGPDFGGYIDVLPEDIDGGTLEAAIMGVPPEVVRSCYLHGTPAQLEARIREYADAGLRHIVLAPLSALVRRRDLNYVAWVLPRLVRALRH
jgi:phthiodiolone/phenolphthiodiolone dimycocerosates ketoreductase